MAEEVEVLLDAPLSPLVAQSQGQQRLAADEQPSTFQAPPTDAVVLDLSPSASGPVTVGSLHSPSGAVTVDASPPASAPGTIESLPQSSSDLKVVDASSPANVHDDVNITKDAADTASPSALAVASVTDDQTAVTEVTPVVEVADLTEAMHDEVAETVTNTLPKHAEQENASQQAAFEPEVALTDTLGDNVVTAHRQEAVGEAVPPAKATSDNNLLEVRTLPGQVQTLGQGSEGQSGVSLPQAQDTSVEGPSERTEAEESTAVLTSQQAPEGLTSQVAQPPATQDSHQAANQSTAQSGEVEASATSLAPGHESMEVHSQRERKAALSASSQQPDGVSPALGVEAAESIDASKNIEEPKSSAVPSSVANDETASTQPGAIDSETLPTAAVDVGAVPTKLLAADGETTSTKQTAATDSETAQAQPIAAAALPDTKMHDVVDASAAEVPSGQKSTTAAPVEPQTGAEPTSEEVPSTAQVEPPDGVSTLPPPQEEPDANSTLTVPESSVTFVPPPVVSATTSSTPSPESETLVSQQIALLLKINKELIRLCVDLQAKEMTGDVIYKTCAVRLQSNLGFLAGLTESTSGKSSASLNDEPFPVTMHAPDSLLPKLYAHLRSLSTPAESPTAAGKKRRRGTTEHEASPARGAPNRAGSVGAKTAAATPAATPASKPRVNNSRRKSSAAGTATATAGSPVVSAFSAPGSVAMPAQQSGPSMSFTNAAPSPAPSMANGFAAASGPPRSAASPAPNAASTAGSPPQQPNGVRASGPTPQQLQGLIQAFGQNAVTNLNALQAHYRGGQQQALVNYMEANVANFRNLPLQMQLQHMATVQNAALQRQRQASVGSASSPNAGGGQAASQAPQPRPTPPSRRTSAAPSPAGASAATEHMRRNTQSPMAAPATPFQNAAAQQQQQQQSNNTPVMMAMPFAANSMASPASVAAAPSPGVFQQQQQHYQNVMQQQQAQQQQQMANPYAFAGQQPMPQLSTSQAQQLMTSLPTSLAGLPAHLQQQFVQQILQQQQQLTSQPMAAPDMSGNVGVGGGMNPMMAAMMQQQQQNGNAANMFRGVGLGAAGGQGSTPQGGVPNLANMWAAMQQQQNPPSSSS